MTTFSNTYFADSKGTLTAAGENAVASGLAVLIDAVTANNYEKGWRVDPEKLAVGATLPAPRNVGELIALLHSEVTEAFEAHRNNEPKLWFEYEVPGPNGETLKNKPTDGFSDQPSFGGALGKPQGIASELADVIIRVLDMADELDIPLIDAVIDKHRYNQTRPIPPRKQGVLMSDVDDRERGLYTKYRVEKHNDDGSIDVLEAHDPDAIAALRAYAASCADGFGTLATELVAMADRWEAEQNRPRIRCSLCRRERTIRDAYDYNPLQVLTGQPLGWYSGDDGEVCPECMTKSQAGQW